MIFYNSQEKIQMSKKEIEFYEKLKNENILSILDYFIIEKNKNSFMCIIVRILKFFLNFFFFRWNFVMEVILKIS